MIETPLDTLNLRRKTFVKSLVDGIGLSEAANEYLEAHGSVTKADLYYESVYNEDVLLMIAKQEQNQLPQYGVDFFDQDSYIEPGQNISAEGAGFGGEKLTFDVGYKRDTRATQFDNVPHPESTIEENHYLQPHNNPLMQNLLHTFSNGSKDLVPAWFSIMANYHKVSDDDPKHRGQSRAEYDDGRIRGWLKDGRDRSTPNVANMGNMLDQLNTNDSNHLRLAEKENRLGPEKNVELHLEEMRNGDFTLKDYLFGLEGFNKAQREHIYDYISKNGLDKDEDLSDDTERLGINTARLRFNLGLRAKSLLDSLTKQDTHASENDFATPEAVAAEHSEIPNHVFDSLFPKQKRNLQRGIYAMLGLPDKNKEIINRTKDIIMTNNENISENDAYAAALEADILRHDLFKYDNKTKQFTMDDMELDKPVRGWNDWLTKVNPKNITRSGLYAAVNWDPKFQSHYESGKHPSSDYRVHQIIYDNFKADDIKDIDAQMQTGKDAIYDSTEMRNHAIPYMNRRVDLEEAGGFMNDDHRGFNDMFSQIFQSMGGHHLDLNNALKVIAPIFHHKGQNLLFDIEHPESYSRRSNLYEDADKDLYYIGPREEFDSNALTGTGIAKPLLSTSNTLSWAGQPQLTRFFHNVYDDEEFADYEAKKALGLENVKFPEPTKVVLRSLGDIPKYDITKNIGRQRQKDALLEMKAAIEPSAQLSQYNRPYMGIGRGTGGLDKSIRGRSHSVEDTIANKKQHRANMRESYDKIKEGDWGRYRMRGQGSTEGDYESIPDSFRFVGPDAHRKEISRVDQQTRAEYKKIHVSHNKHEMLGGGNHPFNPQRNDVLGLGDAESFNESVTALFRHAHTKDDVTREKELQDKFDIAAKRVQDIRIHIRDHDENMEEILQRIKEPGISNVERNRLYDDYENLGNAKHRLIHGTKANGDLIDGRVKLHDEFKEARHDLAEYLKGPQLTKEALMDKLNTIHEYEANDDTDNEDYKKIKEELADEVERLRGYKPNTFTRGPREKVKKLAADINAIGMKSQDNRAMIDAQGISMGEGAHEMLSNAVVVALESERDLHMQEPDDRFQTYNTSSEDGKTELPEGGKTHNLIRELVKTNGLHTGHAQVRTQKINFGLGTTNVPFFDNERGFTSNNVFDKLREIQSAHPPEKLKEVAPHIRQMSVHDLLIAMHPELKGDLLEQSEDWDHPVNRHVVAMRHLLHLDDEGQPTEKTRIMEEQLGIHFVPPRHSYGGAAQILDGHIVVNPSTDTKGVSALTHPSFKNRMGTISNISERGGNGVTCIFTDPSDHFKWTGYRPTIKAIRDHNQKIVRWENVEPYDFSSRTMPMSMYERIIPEFVEQWGHLLGKHNKVGFGRPPAFSGLEKKHDVTEGAILLASLSDPDIMLKADADYPILQPMHRIFKLEDLEHLRGFSGDWIVSAMPEGPRYFVEKKGKKVSAKGDAKLDKETKKNFSKISDKDFVVDVVYADDEYNVIDIVEYDDGDVFDLSLQERIKILRGTMESTENVLLPAAHNLRLTDDVGLEAIIKDLRKEHDRLVLRDANSTYMKGESRHPKWVLFDEGQDINLMVLDRKGTSSYTYRLGTGPITHEESLGNRAVEYEGDTYMDVGTSFQSKDKYELGDIVTVNVDTISVTENVDGADIYTVNSNEIKGEAEGEGVSSTETLSMFTKSEPTLWPHEIDREGDRIVIKMAAGDVSYRASSIDGEWYMFNPKAENGWLIRLAESQRPFWSPVAGVMLKADLIVMDEESKAEVHESEGEGEPLIPPKKVEGTDFWEKDKVRRLLAKSLNLVSSMLKSSVGAVGDSSTGAMGLGIGYATPIESPSGPTSLVGSKTMPDHDVRDIEREKREMAEDKKSKYRKPALGEIVDDTDGHLSIDRDKAAFVPY